MALASISQSDFLHFNQLLASLSGTGLPLDQALFLAANRVRDPSCAKELEEVGRRIQEGQPPDQAMAGNPRIFSPIYVSIVDAGCRNGDLAAALRLYVAAQERLAEASSWTAGVLAYPMVLFGMLTVFCAIALTLVLPSCKQALEEIREYSVRFAQCP